MRLSKLLFILLLSFIFISCHAQKIPKSYEQYERFIDKKDKRAKKQERKNEVVLSPIEQIPEPIEYSSAPRNWGLDFHKQVFDKIEQRAERSVLVVIFDTGGAYNHLDLEYCELEGLSFTGEKELKDGNGHSTHVAGIIAAEDEDIGLAYPVAKKGLLKIMPIKVLNNNGSGTYNQIYTAIKAVNEIVDDYINLGWGVVYNFSLGGGGSSSSIDAALLEAKNKGVIIVAASGNDGTPYLSYPSSSKYANSIGALTIDATKANFSNFGEGLHSTAAGVSIYSTWPDNKYATLSGTSMATPAAAAIHAIALSCLPNYTPQQIETIVKETAQDITPDGYDTQTGYGYGVISAILEYEDDGTPDEPVEDEPEQPEDPKVRDIKLPYYFEDDLTIAWGFDFHDLETAKVALTISVQASAGVTDKAMSEFYSFTKGFFNNRGLLFVDPTRDTWDVAYYTAHFYEMFAKKYGAVVDVVDITVKNEDERALYIENPIKTNTLVKDLPCMLINTN